MKPTEDALLFVFGTLKKGFPNFHLNRARLIEARCKTQLAYPLYLVGSRYSPWLIDEPGKGDKVEGELYQVSPQQLAAMDQLERIERSDGYRRQIIQVCTRDNRQWEAFCYLKPPAQLIDAEIRLGPLAHYSPAHAALYRSRL